MHGIDHYQLAYKRQSNYALIIERILGAVHVEQDRMAGRSKQQGRLQAGGSSALHSVSIGNEPAHKSEGQNQDRHPVTAAPLPGSGTSRNPKKTADGPSTPSDHLPRAGDNYISIDISVASS